MSIERKVNSTEVIKDSQVDIEESKLKTMTEGIFRNRKHWIILIQVLDKGDNNGTTAAAFEFEIKKIAFHKKQNEENFATFGKPDNEQTRKARSTYVQSQRQSELKRRVKVHQNEVTTSPLAYQFNSPINVLPEELSSNHKFSIIIEIRKKSKTLNTDKGFVKDVEAIATLLREANQVKKDLLQFKKGEAQLGIMKKLYMTIEENRRLKMENLRLKSELSSHSPTGRLSGLFMRYEWEE